MVVMFLVVALEVQLQEIINVCTWYEIKGLLQNQTGWGMKKDWASLKNRLGFDEYMGVYYTVVYTGTCLTFFLENTLLLSLQDKV